MVRQELLFWSENIDSLDFQSFAHYTRLPEIVLYTDASSHACAGFCVQISDSRFHSVWSPVERSLSSTWRELRGVELALQSYAPQLDKKYVHVFTDCQNVARILEVGSVKPALQDIALRIFDLKGTFSFSL